MGRPAEQWPPCLPGEAPNSRSRSINVCVRVGEPGLLGAAERESSSAALGEVKLTFKHAHTQALRPRHHATALSVLTISQNCAKSTQFTSHTFSPREGRPGSMGLACACCHRSGITRWSPMKYDFGRGQGPAKSMVLLCAPLCPHLLPPHLPSSPCSCVLQGPACGASQTACSITQPGVRLPQSRAAKLHILLPFLRILQVLLEAGGPDRQNHPRFPPPAHPSLVDAFLSPDSSHGQSPREVKA